MGIVYYFFPSEPCSEKAGKKGIKVVRYIKIELIGYQVKKQPDIERGIKHKTFPEQHSETLSFES
jgi:hypothetical protein